MAPAWLAHHHTCTPEHPSWGTALTSLREQSTLQGPRDEDILHAGVRIGQQARHELPVAGVVEAQMPIAASPNPAAAEFDEAAGLGRDPVPIVHVESEVHVATVLVRLVPADFPSVAPRELSDRKPGTRQPKGHAPGHTLQQSHELQRPVEVAAIPVLGHVSNVARGSERDRTEQGSLPGKPQGAAGKAGGGRLRHTTHTCQRVLRNHHQDAKDPHGTCNQQQRHHSGTKHATNVSGTSSPGQVSCQGRVC